MEELIADRVGERRAEHRDRRGEHQARLVAAADQANGIDQHPRAVEIDAVALVEIELGLAGDDGGEMEDHVGPVGDQLLRGARDGEITRVHLDRKAGFSGVAGATTSCSVMLRDVGLAEPAVFQQPLDQFAADHAGRAQNQNVQESLLVVFSFMRAPESSVKILMVRRRECAVSNHEVPPAASSFETRSRAPQDEGWSYRRRAYSFTAPVIADT